MAARARFGELARQLSAVGAVNRGLARALPAECPAGAAAVLHTLDRHGEMRISKLAELLTVDMSVTSRHVAHVTDRGWVDRSPDPDDKRSRILRLTPSGKVQLNELAERYSGALAHYLDGWSDDEIGQLTVLLTRLRGEFGDCRAPSGRHPYPRSRPASAPTPTGTAPLPDGTVPVPGGTAPVPGHVPPAGPLADPFAGTPAPAPG
ncbi:MarR family transcriptional regulator [Streptomyces uncialis]|uniref:MarR family winged helix-turn-helix transcriptional regulator n=1 Tax=Streptomyces uncialis TaxID=1048205 RepID=UPI002E3741C9|nr:MarR family transcriptional regulator [Streptomyces uncialis]WTE11859.1 MarR family transcriptional regulator [Streptomyces uncialis]